jgi:hypothetical protein
MHCVIETPSFRKSAKKINLTEDERFEITTTIAADPLIGDLIPGAGGARKIRFPKEGKGKSAGYRVITYYPADDIPVFLLDIFDKGEKINLSQVEKNELRKYLGGIAEDYRASTKSKVARLRREKR